MKVDNFWMLIVFLSIISINPINCSKESKSQETANKSTGSVTPNKSESNDTIIQKMKFQKGRIDAEINEWFKDDVRKKIDYNRSCASNVSRDSIDKLLDKYIKLFEKSSNSEIIPGPEICNSDDIDLLLEGIILANGVINKQLILWLPLGCKGEFPHQEKIDSLAKANISFCTGMVLYDVRNTWETIYKYRKLPLKDFLKSDNRNPLDTLIIEDMTTFDLIRLYYLSCERFGWV